MYCSNCGTEMNEGDKFCYRCGEKNNEENYKALVQKQKNEIMKKEALSSTIMGGISIILSSIPFINIMSLIFGGIALGRSIRSLSYGIRETKNKNKIVSTIVLGGVGLYLSSVSLIIATVSLICVFL